MFKGSIEIKIHIIVHLIFLPLNNFTIQVLLFKSLDLIFVFETRVSY